MPEWLWMPGWLEKHPWVVGAAAATSVVTLVGSAILLPVVVARMPADYFTRERGRQVPDAHPLLRLLFHLAKNAAGVVLLLGGLAMLFLPGQGLLTILAALSLLDFPRKRELELWIAQLRGVRGAIAWLRARGGHAPLEYPDPTEEG